MNWHALGAHLYSFGDTDKARQTLGSAGPGNDSQLHLGLTHLRAGRCQPVMAGHGQLQSAAEGVAVNRHHHRLAAVLNV